MNTLIQKLKKVTAKLEETSVSRKTVELKTPTPCFTIVFGKVHGNYVDVHISYPHGRDRHEALSEGDQIILKPIVDLADFLETESQQEKTDGG